MKAELIFHDELTELGEGPIWDIESGCLIWLDITRSIIHEFDPVSGTNKKHHLGNMISCLAPISGRRYIAASKSGIGFLDLDTKKFESLIHPEKDKTKNRFNDGKCDPYGCFWFGSMSMTEDRHQGSLYRLDGNMQVQTKMSDVSISNGMAWNVEGNRMFYIDSLAFSIMAFDFDGSSGHISNKRVLCIIDPREGAFDGMSIDSEDRLWVAVYNAGQVRCIDSSTGELIEVIEVGARKTSSCTFGGPDFGTLFITSIAIKSSKEDRFAGGLFAVRPGCYGYPSDCFKPL